MNPYPDRLAELHYHLETKYSQKDRQATEILLSCLLDPAVTQMRRPWLILETDWYSRECEDAWFSFGLLNVARSLSTPRVQRAQKCESIVQDWIAERRSGQPGIFVESEWRRLPVDSKGTNRFNALHSYTTLLSMCVRLRAAHPRSVRGLRADADADRQELARLTQRVLDNTWRAKGAVAPFEPHARDVPASFMYWCELLQKLAPMQTDWESLTGGLAAIARGIALLWSDGRKPDWQAAERVMRDCVHCVTEEIMRQTALPKAQGIDAAAALRRSGIQLGNHVGNEIKRLHREGIILRRQNYKDRDPYQNHPWKFRISIRDWADLMDRTKRILT
jgi:hypothetical protein